MELLLGSNSFRNTNGILKLQGKEQLVLEMPAGERQLFLTMDLYDPEGKHVAHVRRNQLAFNDKDRFALSTSSNILALFTGPAWVKVTDTTTGGTVLEATVAGQDKVSLVSGKFHTHKGQLIEITPHVCRIQGVLTKFNEVCDVQGGMIELG